MPMKMLPAKNSRWPAGNALFNNEVKPDLRQLMLKQGQTLWRYMIFVLLAPAVGLHWEIKRQEKTQSRKK